MEPMRIERGPWTLLSTYLAHTVGRDLRELFNCAFFEGHVPL